MKAGGIFGNSALGVVGGGVFGGKPVGCAGLGLVDFQGNTVPASVVTACATACKDVGSQGGNPEACAAACVLVGGPAKAAGCQTKCKQYNQDTPEWANCIQKCQGFNPVDYGTEKSACEKQGKVYSWLENGCVAKDVLDSCPAGTMYATYPDGSKKCIAQTDVTTTKCPAGTSLQTVAGGGKTCVSPVKPKDSNTKTPVAPVKTTPTPVKTTPTPAKTPQEQGMLSNPLVWGALAAVGIGAAILLTGKKKGETGKKGSRSSVRKNCRRR